MSDETKAAATEALKERIRASVQRSAQTNGSDAAAHEAEPKACGGGNGEAVHDNGGENARPDTDGDGATNTTAGQARDDGDETIGGNAKEGEDAVIARLAALPPLEYARQRCPAANMLGHAPATLDKAVSAVRKRIDAAERDVRKQAEAAEREAKKQARQAEQQIRRQKEEEARSAREAEKANRETEQREGFTITPEPEPRFVNLLALVNHIKTTPAWDGALRHNQLTGKHEILGAFPPDSGSKDTSRPFEDPDDTYTSTMYFQAAGFAKAGKQTAFDAIAAVALRHKYHPIRDYLNALKWDGTQRLGRLFEHYFKAEMPPATDQKEHAPHVTYLKHISTCSMISAVARAMEPGCKADYIVVLVGLEQGEMKSKAIRGLCPDPSWFSDDISTQLIDRDTKESLEGKWLIELAELPHIRHETEKMKAFFSRCEDRYRAAYGRANQDHPRQCIFWGTSNDLEFLDVTGNRRFWPFLVGLIDIEAIIRDRDQLWAESVHLYRKGVQWWLPSNIELIAQDKQAAFLEADLWDDIITDWTAKRDNSPFTMVDLFAKGTGITHFRETVMTLKAEEMRASRSLRKLGWVKSRCTLHGKKAVWWQRRKPR